SQTTMARLRPFLVVAQATTATFGCGRRTRSESEEESSPPRLPAPRTDAAPARPASRYHARMNYHLGRLPLDPDLLHLHPGHGVTLRQMLRLALSRQRQLVEFRRSVQDAPDLLAELRRDPGVDAWVCELAAALDRRPGLRLVHCEREPGEGGHVAISVV